MLEAVPESPNSITNGAQPISNASIQTAILQTIAYVDVFDYPLTAAEVHHHLIGVPASLTQVKANLANGQLVPHKLAHHQGYYMRPGREAIIETRQRREGIAQKLWPEAIRYGRLIARLPFIRMVCVTGSLAVNNVEDNADIDYLIITENGRLWLSRAFTIFVVRLAARRNIHLCPNYFLSQRMLTVSDRNLYTAHELVQMVPIAGQGIYQQLQQLNTWTKQFLPNAAWNQPPLKQAAVPIYTPPPYHLGQALELILRSPLGTGLEQWEMNRKIRKLNHQQKQQVVNESDFSPDWCKGHFDSHAHRTLTHFKEQAQALKQPKQMGN